jgi:hypothetical protein
MKRVETGAITDSVRLPLKKTVLDYIQDMTKEIFKEMIISMIGSTYSTSTVYILEGVVNTSANIFTAGSIFYNGVVYLVDAVTLTAGTPYFSLVDVVDEIIVFSDGSFHDTLISHKAQLLVTGGTTIGNYSAAVIITFMNLVTAQTIAGVKTFSSTIVGSITGNAGTVTGGVYTSGAQTIADVKTFSSSPIVPTPTTAMQASTKKYVDDLVSGELLTSGQVNIEAVSNNSWNNQTVTFSENVGTTSYFVEGYILNNDGDPSTSSRLSWSVKFLTATQMTLIIGNSDTSGGSAGAIFVYRIKK